MYNAFIFQLLGVNPCKVFRKLKTKHFAKRYLDSCSVSLEFLDVYIKKPCHFGKRTLIIIYSMHV